MYKKSNYSFIFLVIVCGALISSSLSMFLTSILPIGVVKDFFLLFKTIGWDPLVVDLYIINFTIGLNINISTLSIIGMSISWYFLRYFK